MARSIISDNIDDDMRILVQSDKAWLASLPLIREWTQQEQQAEADRMLAARLGGITVEELPEEQRRLAMLLDDLDDDIEENVEKPALTTSETPALTTSETPALTTSETPASKRHNKVKKCAACFEPVTEDDPCIPCGHVYNLECLKSLFTAAMKDESLMPPRCCQKEIPVELVRFDPDELNIFNAKCIEFATENRLYCYKPQCSAFIPPTSIVNQIGTCPKSDCGATTCQICKGPSHDQIDCPKDDATHAVLEEARKAGWARCHKCRTMVELTAGCYHMTCRCRAEFCYLCAVPWKNCSCAQWDEARLLHEAQHLIRREQNNLPQVNNEPNNEHRVQNMVRQLRNNYECRHQQRWIYARGGGRCELCHHFLPLYLFRCTGCRIRACNRCRHNRV